MQKNIEKYSEAELMEAIEIRERLNLAIGMYEKFLENSKKEDDRLMVIANDLCLHALKRCRYGVVKEEK